MKVSFYKVAAIKLLQIMWVFGQALTSQQMRSNACKELESETRVTYPNWPFQIDCDRMAEGVSKELGQCYVSFNDSNVVLSSGEFRLNSSKSFKVLLVHSNGNCWKKSIAIELRSLAKGLTFDSINSDYLKNRSVVYERKFFRDQMIVFDCLPLWVQVIASFFVKSFFYDQNCLSVALPTSSSNGGKPYLIALPPTYNVTWWQVQRFTNGSLSRKTDSRPLFRNYSNLIKLSNLQRVSNPPSPYTLKKMWHMNHFSPTWPEEIVHVYKMLVKETRSESAPEQTKLLMGKRGGGSIAVELSKKLKLLFRQKYNVDFEDAALYSCQLQYKKETAFIKHQSICVAPSTLDASPPKIHCPELQVFGTEENFKVECRVFSSNAMIEPGQLSVDWRKKSSGAPDCQYLYKSKEEFKSTDERYSCSIEGFSNPHPTCFIYELSRKDQRNYPDRKDFAITFTIKDIGQSDSGSYFVRVKYNGGISNEAVTILKFNEQDELRQVVNTLLFLLATLIAILFFMMFVWHYWIQIYLRFRKLCTKYDSDSKEFVAILSYVYSEDLCDVTRRRTKKIVRSVQEKMEEMNYSFYDSHKHFNQGYSVSNLLKYLDRSHRMIVILTDAYLGERWSRFEAQQGFLNLMMNRTKLIFVLTPGAVNALKECIRKGDNFAFELYEAIKASDCIKWTEKMTDSRFKDHLQYVLPNLQRLPPREEEVEVLVEPA